MKEGPDGITLDAPLGSTDRGALWRASRRREHDRIVRLIEPVFCDGRFKQALANVRHRHHPRMLAITGEGLSGAHFYIEYAADAPWQTLGERLGALGNWRDRMAVLGLVCDALSHWSTSPVHPLGLNANSIVMVRDAGRWLPWLLPCPAITTSSPCDLFGVDPAAVAALAPEEIRGVQLDHRAQDAYAIGTLVAQAVGCTGPRLAADDDETRIETQARGALLRSTVEHSEIEPFLQQVPQVQELFRRIRHHRHPSPDARPGEVGKLRSAIAAVADPVALATALRHTNPHAALRVLAQPSVQEGHQLASSILAAEICVELGNLPEALRHLDRAVSVAPFRIDLRKQCCDLRWLAYLELPPLVGEDDPEGQELLKDLTWLKVLDPLPGNEAYLRAADVHRRRGEFDKAATELYEAAEREPGDLEALLRYAECWKTDLGDRDTAAAIVNEALSRIGKLERSEMLTEVEARQWRELFAALLS